MPAMAASWACVVGTAMLVVVGLPVPSAVVAVLVMVRVPEDGVIVKLCMVGFWTDGPPGLITAVMVPPDALTLVMLSTPSIPVPVPAWKGVEIALKLAVFTP